MLSIPNNIVRMGILSFCFLDRMYSTLLLDITNIALRSRVYNNLLIKYNISSLLIKYNIYPLVLSNTTYPLCLLDTTYTLYLSNTTYPLCLLNTTYPLCLSNTTYPLGLSNLTYPLCLSNYYSKNYGALKNINNNCYEIAEGFRLMPFSLVRLRTFRLSTWVGWV